MVKGYRAGRSASSQVSLTAPFEEFRAGQDCGRKLELGARYSLNQEDAMLRLQSLARLAVIALVFPATAFGFGSTNSFGQSAEHEMITRLALKSEGFGSRTMDEIAGKNGTFGAVAAPDRPDRGLMMTAAAHCDDGDYLDVPGYPHSKVAAEHALSACRSWIFNNLASAVSQAGALTDKNGRIRSSEIPTQVPCFYNGKPGRAKCEVLESLGLAFHAAQDFYAHSNWTDRPPKGAITLTDPPGLGNTAPAPWLNPQRQVPFPKGLISGCYEGSPETLFCKGRIRHGDLNKDTGPINPSTGQIGAGTTPRGEGNDNFARAARAAVADTREKWVYFQQRILATYGESRGEMILCAIRSDDPIHSCK